MLQPPTSDHALSRRGVEKMDGDQPLRLSGRSAEKPSNALNLCTSQWIAEQLCVRVPSQAARVCTESLQMPVAL